MTDIPDAVRMSFPVAEGLLTAEEAMSLLDLCRGLLCDFRLSAKVALVVGLRDLAADLQQCPPPVPIGDIAYWAHDAADKVKGLSDAQCERLLGWATGWVDRSALD